MEQGCHQKLTIDKSTHEGLIVSSASPTQQNPKPHKRNSRSEIQKTSQDPPKEPCCSSLLAPDQCFECSCSRTHTIIHSGFRHKPYVFDVSKHLEGQDTQSFQRSKSKEPEVSRLYVNSSIKGFRKLSVCSPGPSWLPTAKKRTASLTS